METLAPPSLQESYDNAGLLLGSAQRPCSGVLVALDVTEAVLEEAEARGCSLVVTHHPLIFKGMKRIVEEDPVGRLLLRSIRAGISLYAIHTNLDNVIGGVNGMMADRLGLTDRAVLQPLSGRLLKLHTYVPVDSLPRVREALFAAGAGHVGGYSACSFSVAGIGSFTPGEGTNPFIGEKGKPHFEAEERMEVILPDHLEGRVLRALREAHPYEEVAYGIVRMENVHEGLGAGLVGSLPAPLTEAEFLDLAKERFEAPWVRHSPFLGRPVRRVALCGGAGAFLLPAARGAGADAFLTADITYHRFFEPDGALLLADIGHYESEQFTSDLLCNRIREIFPNFAVHKSGVNTNPVNYR